jgi:parvulin-like peptidyl-prolyl isomerase
MQVLAMQCEDKYVANTFEIPPGDILDYYEKNIDKWRMPARVKWRELVIRFDKHASKDEAKNAINNLGNEVFLTGKPFEAVARDSSEGHNAKDGGNYEWTTVGSLKSEVIETALFNLPLRRLSEVIEDDIGYHIVEVLEREPARIQEMSEIQTEIRTKLSNEIRAEKLQEFRKKILIRTPVWTMWPEDIQGSKPLVAVQESE